MSAAGDVGMGEGCTGKRRRVSVNSGGLFIRSPLPSVPFTIASSFHLSDCFSRNPCFSFIQLASSNVFSFSCIYGTRIQLLTALSSPPIVAMKLMPQPAMLTTLDLTTISLDGPLGSALYDISIDNLSF